MLGLVLEQLLQMQDRGVMITVEARPQCQMQAFLVINAGRHLGAPKKPKTYQRCSMPRMSSMAMGVRNSPNDSVLRCQRRSSSGRSLETKSIPTGTRPARVSSMAGGSPELTLTDGCPGLPFAVQ